MVILDQFNLLYFIIELMIIFTQIYHCCSWLYPNQYKIYEQWFSPQSQYYNNTKYSDNIKGLYKKTTEKITDELLQMLSQNWIDFGVHLREDHIVQYDNAKGSQLFIVCVQKKQSDEYHWYLHDKHQSRFGNSSIFQLFVYDENNEHLEIAMCLSKLFKLINDKSEEHKIFYPYYPKEYKIDVNLLSETLLGNSYGNIEGIYKIIKFKIDDHDDLYEKLKQEWNYPQHHHKHIRKYGNVNGFILLVCNSAERRRYTWALLDQKTLKRKYGESQTSDLFAFTNDDVQLIMYDNKITVKRLKHNNIPILAIYLMMILSVSFVLMIFGIIIKKLCIKQSNHEHHEHHDQITQSLHYNQQFVEAITKESLYEAKSEGHTIASTLQFS